MIEYGDKANEDCNRLLERKKTDIIQLIKAYNYKKTNDCISYLKNWDIVIPEKDFAVDSYLDALIQCLRLKLAIFG